MEAPKGAEKTLKIGIDIFSDYLTFNVLMLNRFSRQMSTTVYDQVKIKLSSQLNPIYLEIVNESHKHNVPVNSETHFKVFIVSNQFENKSLVERHRMVNRILVDELKHPIHALSIKAITEAQYTDQKSTNNAAIQSTPNCLGGSKH